MIGKKFGAITVIKMVSGGDNPVIYGRCDCGTSKHFHAKNVWRGMSQSCGCLKGKKISEAKTTHGLCHHALYATYKHMVGRCEDSSCSGFKDYGGRGIRVCRRWKDIRKFVSDMAPSHRAGLQLDRINNNGNYSPSNCRWVLPRENLRNTRRNIFFYKNGERLCVSDWAQKLGVSKNMIYARLWRGWDIERAINTPSMYKRNCKKNFPDKTGRVPDAERLERISADGILASHG